MQRAIQQRDSSPSIFDRACVALCLLLLCFSVGHTILGHGVMQQHALMAGSAPVHELAPLSTDTPDACAVCVALASAVVLYVFSITVPRRTHRRPAVVLPPRGPVTGWHPSLFCRPPPAI